TLGAVTTYDSKKQELSCLGKKAPLALAGGSLRLQFFIDRGALDLFANHGAVYMPLGFIAKDGERMLRVTSKNSDTRISEFSTFAIKSTWAEQIPGPFRNPGAG